MNYEILIVVKKTIVNVDQVDEVDMAGKPLSTILTLSTLSTQHQTSNIELRTIPLAAIHPLVQAF